MTGASEEYGIHGQCQRHWEHGQEWLICIECGAKWSVIEIDTNRGEEFEQVSDGDGYCEGERDRMTGSGYPLRPT